MLTVEEMGRTLHYFEWKQSWWLSLRSEQSRSDNPPSTGVDQGLRAYAHRQAHVYKSLITSYANRWRRLLTTHSLGLDWLHWYPLAPDPLSAQLSHGGSQPVLANGAIVQSDSLLLASPFNTDTDVDPPMVDDSESDSDDEYLIDEEALSDFDD